ncbi:MAG: biopolymer transporter ExbD [Planctomycetes bacterium]|nr:biopolymer transporter ExbD [Planctomycetota bacterium]
MRLPPDESQADGPNLTPIIDIVFLLLIFFLVVTQFKKNQTETDVKIPQIVKARPVTSGTKEIVVNITKEGKYKVAGHEYTGPELAALLKKEAKNNPDQQRVQINCDERAQFRYPAQVIGICTRENMKHYCLVEEVE